MTTDKWKDMLNLTNNINSNSVIFLLSHNGSITVSMRVIIWIVKENLRDVWPGRRIGRQMWRWNLWRSLNHSCQCTDFSSEYVVLNSWLKHQVKDKRRVFGGGQQEHQPFNRNRTFFPSSTHFFTPPLFYIYTTIDPLLMGLCSQTSRL